MDTEKWERYNQGRWEGVASGADYLWPQTWEDPQKLWRFWDLVVNILTFIVLITS